MSVHVRAPLRIDFAGGWTDVPEFADAEGGGVTAGAITVSVRIDILLGGPKIKFVAEDLDERRSYVSAGEIQYDGTLDLHKAALNMLPVTGGIEVLTRSDAPQGSGLGGSGALDVGLLAGLAYCRNETHPPEELAEFGFQLETQVLGLLGGRQDQLCAALGGFHEFSFGRNETRARRLDVDEAGSEELASHSCVVYTGRTHFSPATHQHVWDAFKNGQDSVIDALRRMKDVVPRAAECIERGNWEGLASAVSENWLQQQRLHSTIATDRTQRIERAVRDAGAWGVKATGAGAGGCLLVLGPVSLQAAIADAARSADGTILETSYCANGVTVWEEEDAAGDE